MFQVFLLMLLDAIDYRLRLLKDDTVLETEGSYSLLLHLLISLIVMFSHMAVVVAVELYGQMQLRTVEVKDTLPHAELPTE